MITNSKDQVRYFAASTVHCAPGVRVKIGTDGTVSPAGATDPWIGVSQDEILPLAMGPIKLRNASGTFSFLTSGAVAAGAQLYPTAAGCVDDAAGTGCFTGFQAIAAADSGALVEAVPSDLVAFTAAAAQGAITSTVGAAVATTATTQTTPYGFSTQAQGDALVTRVNELRVDVLALQAARVADRAALIAAGIEKGGA